MSEEKEYVETKDSYIKRALADIEALEEAYETEMPCYGYIDKIRRELKEALIIPYSSQDSSADASKPDKQ